MMDGGSLPDRLHPALETSRQPSDHSTGRNNQHITMEEPVRPLLPKRNTLRGESSRSMSEALRLARSREEQETLLGDEEQADDDGCYPPRNIGDPVRVPNPHSSLPVYTTIHKIRRLIIASIGMASNLRVFCTAREQAALTLSVRRSVQPRAAKESPHEPCSYSPTRRPHVRS